MRSKMIICIILCLCLLAGCAGRNVVSDTSRETEPAIGSETVADDTAIGSDAVADDAVIGSGAVADDAVSEAVYEPNIIDDNYRNYYEIFVASYYDSDGDGCGDLRGVEEKLDYISGLGCNGIWLMPVMSAPSYHKYDTDDYYLVDASYGTNDDFRALAEACDREGIRLIIDMVINHSSNEHPWFKEACEYLRTLPADAEPDPEVCPYVDYYHFSREQVSGSYCEVPDSDWYYEAVFYYTQPDLNLDNPAVVEELYKVADFWIDLGCDGFRMDAVMHFDETDTAANIDFLHDYYAHCLERDPDFYMVSEVWASEKDISAYYKSETPSFFNFDAADAEGKLIRAGRGKLSAEKFVSACVDYEETYGASNPEYIDAPFITNHDMGRVANAVQSDIGALKMTGGLLLSMKGSPFIYYGEEIGMKSKGKADENKRLHMNWSETATTGICKDPAGADKDITQSLPPADVQMGDEDSLYSFYRTALAIRNSYPEIARGDTHIISELTSDDVAVITRSLDDETILIAYNTGDEPAVIDLSAVAGLSQEEYRIVGVLCAEEDQDGSGTSDTSEATGTSYTTGLHNIAIDSGALDIPGRTIVYIK